MLVLACRALAALIKSKRVPFTPLKLRPFFLGTITWNYYGILLAVVKGPSDFQHAYLGTTTRPRDLPRAQKDPNK